MLSTSLVSSPLDSAYGSSYGLKPWPFHSRLSSRLDFGQLEYFELQGHNEQPNGYNERLVGLIIKIIATVLTFML